MPYLLTVKGIAESELQLLRSSIFGWAAQAWLVYAIIRSTPSLGLGLKDATKRSEQEHSRREGEYELKALQKT